MYFSRHCKCNRSGRSLSSKATIIELQANSINIPCLLKRSDFVDSSRQASGTSLQSLSTSSLGTLCQKSCCCIWRYEESPLCLQFQESIEILEAETKQNRSCENSSSVEDRDSDQQEVPASEFPEEGDMVQAHHMAVALSKTYRSPVVETIQSLPQHQQTILCSSVKLFHGAKRVASITEDVCKSMKIWPVGISELSSICRVLIDQGILKGGQSNKIALKVDAADIKFALQGIQFFRNCLE
ncbi:AAA ATPase [Ancistrocladus abbreviatus]